MTGKITVAQLLTALNHNAPFALAESWDNVGLLVGDPAQEVRGVLTALDASCTLVDEAIERGANTIVTHHPVIFKPLATINTGQPEGKLLAKALGNAISIIACHTNFDSALDGVNDILARRLGLEQLKPLFPQSESTSPAEQTGIGRIGTLPQPVSGKDFIDRIKKELALSALPVAGPLPETVRCVALCGGSGSDFAGTALKMGADLYLSAEIKHNIAVWAQEQGFCIVDGSHYATEKPAVQQLTAFIRSAIQASGSNALVAESTTEKHPFTYYT